MIKRGGSLPVDIVSNRFGGNGDVKFTRILEKEEFNGKGRLFAITALEPGCSLGLHKHSGEMEAYYILRGQGTVNDNGKETLVGPGDVVLTKTTRKPRHRKHRQYHPRTRRPHPLRLTQKDRSPKVAVLILTTKKAPSFR
jgi:quercetin dioxygenase-like cupin family protein